MRTPTLTIYFIIHHHKKHGFSHHSRSDMKILPHRPQDRYEHAWQGKSGAYHVEYGRLCTFFLPFFYFLFLYQIFNRPNLVEPNLAKRSPRIWFCQIWSGYVLKNVAFHISLGMTWKCYSKGRKTTILVALGIYI